jgi:hypothetical protein
MNNKTLNLKFHGRRKINSSRKRTYIIIGTGALIIGLFGLIKSSFEMNVLFLFFLPVGIMNIIYGLIGKELIKEKNSISVSEDEIEYKNSFRKSKKIKISDLWDLRIESAKVEFVMNDQRVQLYDFSVFQGKELENVYVELEKIKGNLIK